MERYFLRLTSACLRADCIDFILYTRLMSSTSCVTLIYPRHERPLWGLRSLSPPIRHWYSMHGRVSIPELL